MGFETPRELGEHIVKLNANPPKSECCDRKNPVDEPEFRL
jgi:hypothetical protein